MAAIDAIRTALAEVESDLSSLDEQRDALQVAAEGLRSAIAALEGTGTTSSGSRTKRRSRPAARKEPSTPRRTVSEDDLVGAVRDLGGSATVEQLVEKLDLPDGRSLNGARRKAVDAERVAYSDRVYTLPSSDPRWPDDGEGADAA